MLLFSEEKSRQLSIFYKTLIDENGEVVNQRRVTIPLVQVEKDGFTYLVLYDDNMEVIHDAYRYLNVETKENSLNSRKQAATALRLMYCFFSLSGYDVRNLTERALSELIFFLRGISNNPEQYKMLTQRSAKTVNTYLATYRTYFKKLGIESDALFRGSITRVERTLGDYTSKSNKVKYDSNLKTSSVGRDAVPRYISPDEFRVLYKISLEKEDVQAQIMLHLMYGYGLRLGEVLGLTYEDITEKKDHGVTVPMLILRNRMSDKKFQYAKEKPHVLDRKQYFRHDYSMENDEIIISYDLYEKLLNYIEDTHPNYIEKYPANYEKSKADTAQRGSHVEENHYVFLNRFGRVLSDQTWNNKLKEYYLEAGIPVDSDVKRNSLSHRLRHGFAMFHARYSEHPVDVLTLKKMMRHAQVSSTMIYYNPTLEDEFKIKTEFQNELYSMIPELKEDLNIAERK